jgi:tetratricopeptide (TPR) repeat protein
MLKQILYSSALILFFSCNNSSNEKNSKSVSKEDTLSNPEQKLAMIANDFYESKQYALAIPYYDSLISTDSLNAGYYFKRAYCKTILSPDDPTAVADYLKSIERNYSKKQSAYLNIGAAHQFKAVFRCTTDPDRISQLDSALYFYNQCLKIDPNNNKALQWKEEVTNDLTLIRQGIWHSNK